MELHGQVANDAVMSAGLTLMGEEISKEVGPDVSFALFVDWCDGQPKSYVSDVPRPRVVPIPKSGSRRRRTCRGAVAVSYAARRCSRRSAPHWASR